ncbi:MAG: hypothetical protein D3916_03075 [Candidatus Electrothrix sp. MAN1_4]|nr:hypothetical protein [Candidatus Electrothrix sp. MAN1_4]
MNLSPHSSKEQLLNHFSMELYSKSSGNTKLIIYPYGSNFLTGLNPLWVFNTIKEKGKKSGPYMMYFDATNKCGDHCEMCFLYEKRKKTGLKNQIDIHAALSFLDKIFSLSPFLKSVVIGGPGEPLEYSYFEDIVKYFYLNGLSTHIYSSGNGKIQKYLDTIMNYVRLFRVSLDATNKITYFKTHGKKDFEKRLEYLGILVSEKKLRNSNILIGAHFVIQSHNHSEIFEFAKMLKDIGVDYVEFVWESYYVVKGLTESEIQTALEMLNLAKQLKNFHFSIISPLARKKHQLEKENLIPLTLDQVERHCYDLTGRLNYSVGSYISLCAKERFNSNSVFNIGKASYETAIKLRDGIDTGFSNILPEKKIEVGCSACFCNNYNKTMNTMVDFINTYPDAEARLINTDDE